MAFGTLRVWLGTPELVEKRCCNGSGGPVHYSPRSYAAAAGARLAPVTPGCSNSRIWASGSQSCKRETLRFACKLRRAHHDPRLLQPGGHRRQARRPQQAA